MYEQEIARLKNENARLNRILEALLTANEVLRHEIAVLKSGNASPEFGSSIAENGNGITDFGLSITENNKGRTELSLSIAENSNGITDFGSSITENSKGRTELGSSITENGKGITEPFPPLPEKIEVTDFYLFVLRNKLKTGIYAKAKDSGLDSHAKMLFHFHNGGGGSHPELRKLTGLSAGGLSKSITALTKRGLIVRNGYQRFIITPPAKELLKYCLTQKNSFVKQ